MCDSSTNVALLSETTKDANSRRKLAPRLQSSVMDSGLSDLPIEGHEITPKDLFRKPKMH